MPSDGRFTCPACLDTQRYSRQEAHLKPFYESPVFKVCVYCATVNHGPGPLYILTPSARKNMIARAYWEKRKEYLAYSYADEKSDELLRQMLEHVTLDYPDMDKVTSEPWPKQKYPLRSSRSTVMSWKIWQQPWKVQLPAVALAFVCLFLGLTPLAWVFDAISVLMLVGFYVHRRRRK